MHGYGLPEPHRYSRHDVHDASVNFAENMLVDPRLRAIFRHS